MKALISQHRNVVQAIIVLSVLGVCGAAAALTTDRSGEYFRNYDHNRDGKIDKVEWTGRGNFERLDTNHDGFISEDEFEKIYETSAVIAPQSPIQALPNPTIDTTLNTHQVDPEKLTRETKCAISRSHRCDDGHELSQGRGLVETGLSPSFPEGLVCQGVDETYAMSYTSKRGREASHGGIDIPADFNVPILAAAAGTVVGIFSEQDGLARGRTVVLRHTPEDTGSRVWTYTEYAHLNEMPSLTIGQRVRIGEVIGKTGNSGRGVGGSTPKRPRRPAIHFAVYYADGPKFATIRSYVIPEEGQWMDPIAFYKTTPPFDSESLKRLPDAEKFVPIPVMRTSGEITKQDAKVIWPYPCSPIR
jgi:murein DD-endopeptidase MepM/ murein hydrolase activator NlpD